MRPEEPLPPHTKLNYWECLAKQVLLFLDAPRYFDLAHADRPDLYDASHGIGVEVTLALGEIEAEGPVFEAVLQAHRRKLGKLNSGNYRIFPENELFIRTNLLADKTAREQVLRALQHDAAQHAQHFSRVIVEVPFCLYIFDLDGGTVNTHSYPKEARLDSEEAARAEVIAAEELATEDKFEKRRRILHSLPHEDLLPADLDAKEYYRQHLIEKYINEGGMLD